MSSPTQMMPVADVMKMITSSSDVYGDPDEVTFWFDLMMEKASDSGFDRLVESILTNGWEKGSAISIIEGYLYQGHHRLVAAILLGLDEIPVSDGSSNTSPGTLCAHFDSGPRDAFSLFDEKDYANA